MSAAAGLRDRLRSRGVSPWGGGLAMLIGTAVLLGWSTGVETLTSIRPRFIAMLPNTAVGMVTAGLAILLLQPHATRRRVTAARGLAGFVLVLGVLSFISRRLGYDVAFVSVLFYERVAQHPYRPIGLMATNSTITFTLSAIALLLISSPHAARRRAARVLALVGGAVALVALLGHLYGARVLFAIDRAAGMALLTAMAFASIQIGILFLRPEDDDISLVTGADLAGRVSRRLLPPSLAFPVFAGLVLLLGHQRSWFTQETGLAVFVMLTVAWVIAVSLYNARFIRQSDSERAALLGREQQARMAAESASKAKSDFLAVMSHELRTPLNAIVGYAELLAERTAGPITDTQVSHLARIRDSARHLTRVVDDILTLTRLESGREETVHVPVLLPGLLHEIHGIIAPLALAKGLEFECVCDEPILLDTDPHRLRQILINLGGNAVKFTSAGSVRMRARREDGGVAIDVEDTGSGISAEHLEHIFEDFWQAERPLTRSHGGTGLGLAVSRRLARRLGGDISVRSRRGAGSCFTLHLKSAAVVISAHHAAGDAAQAGGA